MLTTPANVTSSATMTSREVADLTGKRHDQVLRTARDLVEQGITQSVECHYQATEDGRSYPQHLLNKRDSLVLVARLSPEFTGRVVDRWLELESAAPAALAIPSNFAAALRLAADQQETIQAQADQLAAAAPAVEFVEKYVDATGLKGFRQVCKLLGANEHDFRKFLEDAKIMYRLGNEWTPYAQHLDTGRFDVRAGTSGTGHAFNTARFTPKGVTWVAGEYAKWKLRPIVEEVSHA